MNNSSLEFSPFNWLSLVSGSNRRFALKYITVENTNFKGNVIMIQVLYISARVTLHYRALKRGGRPPRIRKRV